MANNWPANEKSRWWEGPVASSTVDLGYVVAGCALFEGLVSGNIVTAALGAMTIESLFWVTRD